MVILPQKGNLVIWTEKDLLCNNILGLGLKIILGLREQVLADFLQRIGRSFEGLKLASWFLAFKGYNWKKLRSSAQEQGAVRPGSGRGAPRRSAPDSWRSLGQNHTDFISKQGTLKASCSKPTGERDPAKGKDKVRD
ncbi:hypothetical protein L2E82_14018 [Cichorium intybus]|uniref:Uncharacterized protein n=1 Tax=Cichorium intybus TaxID=13427 RepID=A0ACB9EY79_CICIN|nr:hypothetical protein L2E82_14018 [Cichorium intybus]